MIRWITSYPKSGNTWVRLFLMAYEDPEQFDPNQRWGDQAIDTSREFYEQAAGADLEALTASEVLLVRGAALVRLNRQAHTNTGGSLYLKSHSANVTLNGLSWIPPAYTKSTLYILRDPRDVVISMADHMGLSIDETTTVMADKLKMLGQPDALYVPLLSWSDHVQSWLRELPYDQFALRYEDVLADPGRWFQAVLNFFGIAFDRTRFNDALELTTFDHLHAAEEVNGYDARSGHQKRFFRSGKAGGWRDVLSADQAARIEADHGAMMRKCKYLTAAL